MGPRLRPTFGRMAAFLTDLGFAARSAENNFTVFRYTDPDAVLWVKTPADDEPVREADLLTVRKFLTERDIVSDDEFDRFLVDAILARYAPRPEPVTSHPG